MYLATSWLCPVSWNVSGGAEGGLHGGSEYCHPMEVPMWGAEVVRWF